MGSTRVAASAALAPLLLGSCILFVDLDPLGNPGNAKDGGADGAGDSFAPSLDGGGPDGRADADDRFCAAYPDIAVCEDFDRGKANPALAWLPEVGTDNGEMRIVQDAFVSPPSSLWISIEKNTTPNIREFLTATPSVVGTKTKVSFAFRPIKTDYVIFAAAECQTDSGWDGISFSFSPDGSVDMAHGYNLNPQEIGTAGVGVFTALALTMNIASGHVTGDVKLGTSPSVSYDRPVSCHAGAGQRVRLGLEGAGGTAVMGFDNLLYDVKP